MNRVLLAVVGAVLLVTTSARAHELRPASLALVERAPGKLLFRFTPPTTARAKPLTIDPVFPDHCRAYGSVLECGSRGLTGVIEFPGLEASSQRVVVRIEWLGGCQLLRVADAKSPRIHVLGVAERAAASDLLAIARDYAALGIQHILTGVDHLLFVFGLLFLVGFNRKLVVTITAFTAAHSLTLGAAALGLTHLPSAPVEASIALSILLVALECEKRTRADHTALAAPSRATWTQRAPWAVAFAFGLLHGFGFAGTLAEIGVPPHQTPLALAFFNLGVELGQLGAIASAWLVVQLGQLVRVQRIQLQRAAIYAVGGLAGYWCIERSFAVFGG